MTKDHWKPNLLLALLRFLFLSGTVLKESHGQAGSNYFYYYTPTQRTMVNHGVASGGGQLFSSPFFTQNHQQQQQLPQQQAQQPASQQHQAQQPSLPFPTVPPSFQQTTLLGYNHPHFQRQQQHQQQTTLGSVFPPAPPAQLQYPLVPPTPSQQPPHPQQQQLGPQSPSYNTFTNFGHNSHLFGQQQQFQQPPQPSYFSTQSPLGTVAPGTFNFFENPFNYFQNRFQNEVPAQPTPVPSLPTPTTTIAPPPPPSPTPASSEMVDSPQVVEQVVERRQKFSSRFRYVQQPTQPQIQQYNPYTRIGTTYTSDLPFQERRFYSSPTTPTGYAFSLGGENGNGATSTVHFSMGPSSNIQQYLKEITATRSMLQRKPIEYSTPSVPEIAGPVPPSEMMMSHDAPPPEEPTTVAPQTTPAPAPQTPEPMDAGSAAVSEVAMNVTLEPLQHEQSFQTEIIAAPAAPVAPQVSQKISETNIPKRLVIRKKVARKRLRLDGSGEVADAGSPAMPVGVMIRRIASPNRLPIEQPKRSEEENPKGPIGNAALEVAAVTPSTTTTTTTTEPIVSEQPEVHPEMLDEMKPILEQHMEPQTLSSTTASPQPMMPMDETHMDAVTGSQENDNNGSSGNFMQDQHPVPISSPTMPEEGSPMVMNNTNDHVQQPPMEPISTTLAPIQLPPVEAVMSQNEGQSMRIPPPEQFSKDDEVEEYYVEDYEDEAPPQTHSLMIPRKSRIMTAEPASPPASDEQLPQLNGVQKDDFPGVFRHHSSPDENSVETDQGQLITRVTSSHPSAEQEGGEIIDSPPPIPVLGSATTSTTTTTEEIPSIFMRQDPVDEQPPVDSEEPAALQFQPTTTAATPEAVPMMTTTPRNTMGSSTAPLENAEMTSGEVQEYEAMPPQVSHAELSSAELASSTTETLEDNFAPPMNDATISTTESGQQNNENAMNNAAPETNDQNVSSSTENLMPEIEMSAPSSTESAQSDEVVISGSSTTTLPPSATTETSSMEQSSSQEVGESLENEPNSQELISDSEEIGKAQRLQLQETLRRLRERQQTSSTSEPEDQLDNGPDSEGQTGRRVFMRRPLELANLPLPTSRPLPKTNAVLEDEEGADRSQVIEKIQRFRSNFRTTTTKRPRRVTRPSPGTERRLAVVVPVEDLLEQRQQQVDSFSDSSSTPGMAVEQATTTPTPTYSRRRTTTPSTTTTVIPEESSTTPATMTMEDEINYPIYTDASSTETYTTTTRPPMLTRKTDESSSITESMVIFGDEVSSTTETDFEQVTARMQPEMMTTTKTTTFNTTTTTTTEAPMMTTTPSAYNMAATTTPSTTTYPTIMTDFSSDEKDLMINDDDVFYEENNDNAQNIQVSSSTEISIEADPDSTPSSTTSTTTPPSSTDAYMTTAEPISGTTPSSTTTYPDVATTAAGELIIHEILPTMPPLKEVSFVIGDSFEDDQSSAADASSANESDELLAADKAVVRVEAKVHISTNSTDIGGTSVEQSQEAPDMTQPLIATSGESGEGGRRRVRVVIKKKQRRLNRPEGATGNGEGRRRRRKVLHRRRPQ